MSEASLILGATKIRYTWNKLRMNSCNTPLQKAYPVPRTRLCLVEPEKGGEVSMHTKPIM